MNFHTALFSTFTFVALAGCATPVDSNKIYDRSALTSATRTIEATIISKRNIIVDTNSGVGATTGGFLGAIGGSSIGGNSRENLAGAVIGVVAGAVVGAAIESNGSKINAFEYIIKSDVAGLLTIVQIDGEFFVTQKVYVILGRKPVIVSAGQ